MAQATISDISFVQIPANGCSVEVTITGSIDDKSNLYFVFDDISESTDNVIDKQDIIKLADFTAGEDGNGNSVFTVALSQGAEDYDKLIPGQKLKLFAYWTVAGATSTDFRKQKNIISSVDLVFFKGMPFTISSTVGGTQSIAVTIKPDATVTSDLSNLRATSALSYGMTLERSEGNDIVYHIATTDNNYSVAADDNGDITFKYTGLVQGTYRAKVSSDLFNSSTEKLIDDIVVDTNLPKVTVKDFYTFDHGDISGETMTFVYENKSMADYKNIILNLNISQNGVDKGTRVITTGICGETFTNTAPKHYTFDANDALYSDIAPYDNNKAYDAPDQTKKFKVVAWLEASGVDMSDTIQHAGTKKNPSFFWKDTPLPIPTISLDAVNFDSGKQDIEVTSSIMSIPDVSFNVNYDLSGSGITAETITMDVSGGMIYHDKSFTYNNLIEEPTLFVYVERAELNHLTVVDNPPINRSVKASEDKLRPIIRAAQPVVTFTNPSETNYGSIKFLSYSNVVDLSYTDLYGELKLNNVIQDDESASPTPPQDASYVVLDLSGDEPLESGNTYSLNAYSRLDIKGKFSSAAVAQFYFAVGSDDIDIDADANDSANDRYLLRSVVTTTSHFFTTKPSMDLYVIPTGKTNELSTVRMNGDANASHIVNLVCVAVDESNQIMPHSQISLSGNTHKDSCGNTIYNADPSLADVEANVYNTKFFQNFPFSNEVNISTNSFLLGVIDTPNGADGITAVTGVSQHSETSALKTAITAYETELNVYKTAYDISVNLNTDDDYAGHEAAFDNWTASYESLGARAVAISNNLNGSKDDVGSYLNVAHTKKEMLTASYEVFALGKTLDEFGAEISAWGTTLGNTPLSDQYNYIRTQITYTVYTVCGSMIDNASADTLENAATNPADYLVSIEVPVSFTNSMLSNPPSDFYYTVEGLTESTEFTKVGSNYANKKKDARFGEYNTSDTKNSADLAQYNKIMNNTDPAVEGSLKEASGNVFTYKTNMNTRIGEIVSSVNNARDNLVGVSGKASDPKTKLNNSDSLMLDMSKKREELNLMVEGGILEYEFVHGDDAAYKALI